VQSVLAGCDLEMFGPTRERGNKLVVAVRAGRLAADAVRACARRVLQLADRLGSFADPVIPAERADDLPAYRALIRRLGAEGAVLLKNEEGALPLSPQIGQTVALIGRAATLPQIMGGGSANVNAHYRVAPADALRAACPGVNFVCHPGADLHRYTPVLAQPMTLELFASTDLSGPVVATQIVPNSEVQWIGTAPPGVDPAAFSARATLRYVADADGEHAFSLISAGVSRARLNGELVLDAWTRWERGGTYFTFGCNEVVHRRRLRVGEIVEMVVEFSSAVPAGDNSHNFAVLRIGTARVLGEPDIAAAVEASRAADLAIVFAGLNAEWDSEGLDRPGIELPHRQNELITRVAEANPRTVVVLQSGAPLLLLGWTQCPRCYRSGTPARNAATRSPMCCSARPIQAAACLRPGRCVSRTPWPLATLANTLASTAMWPMVRACRSAIATMRHMASRRSLPWAMGSRTAPSCTTAWHSTGIRCSPARS
jgi:beta-glucosidase